MAFSAGGTEFEVMSLTQDVKYGTEHAATDVQSTIVTPSAQAWPTQPPILRGTGNEWTPEQTASSASSVRLHNACCARWSS